MNHPVSGFDRAGDDELDLERVPVQARALVSGRHARQAVRRLEAELVDQTDVLFIAHRGADTLAEEATQRLTLAKMTR